MFDNILTYIALFVSLSVTSGWNDRSAEFDVNDILNADLMPGSLLLLEGDGISATADRSDVWINSSITPKDGTWSDAYSTMGFHRKMMNEYLCRNFVADQILSDLRPAHMERRVGKPSTSPDISDSSAASRVALNIAAVKDSMLADQGSAAYKDWLTKTTTLEDIYRHYERPPQNGKYNLQNIQERQDDDQEEDSEEYDGGEITGYAMPGPAPGAYQPQPYGAGKLDVGGGGAMDYRNGQGATPGHIPNLATQPGYVGQGHRPIAPLYTHAIPVQAGFPQHAGQLEGIPGYEIPLVQPGNGAHEELFNAIPGEGYGGGYGGGYEDPHMVQYHSTGGEKGFSFSNDLGLNEMFDIALTTLAFLSFGMFVLQVIICITAGKGIPVTMMPMDMDPNTSDDPIDGDAEIRTKRDTAKHTRNREINDLARRVLLSIEAVMVAQKDNSVCLRRSVCENNSYSRTRVDQQRIWIPVWSLGLSWLSGRLSTKSSPGTAMLESLRAAALGLGGADCKQMFADCDLGKERSLRLQRRRKRHTKGEEHENATYSDW